MLTANLCPKILNVNPRSLYNKCEQFKRFIKEEAIDVAIISESWERPEYSLKDLLKLRNFEVVSNICQRKGVGGRPAIIVNKEKYFITNLTQSVVDIPWGVEAVWCLLSPKEANNNSKIRNIVVASIYSKPGSRKKSVLLDHVSSVYHLLCSKYETVHWIIAGDFNDTKIDNILALSSQLKQMVKSPTRMNPAAVLDLVITDLHQYYHDVQVLDPLEVDTDKVGQDSDHNIVIVEPLDNVNQVKNRSKKKIRFRPATSASMGLFEHQLNSHDFSYVDSDESVNVLMQKFQDDIIEMYNHYLPVKTKFVSDDDLPYFSDKLKVMRRKVRREYHKHRVSQKYLSLRTAYKNELNKAKKKHYSQNVRRFKTSDPRKWYKLLKSLTRFEKHDIVEVSDIKHLSDEAQTELIADKFSKVSNEYEALKRSEIIIPPFSQSEVLVISEKEVLDVLQGLNPNKSGPRDDIPASILKKFARILSKPLTVLINKCITEGCWPTFMKLEQVTPIAKVSVPQDVNDLRNISLLKNLDKVMEKIFSRLMIADMTPHLDPAQYANQKGLSTNHYLIKMLDQILAALDKQGDSSAVLAMMIDWKEAFPRQCPTLAVQSFIQNGVRPCLIPLIMSYFEGRQMFVSWHGHDSSVREMPGGGPQGGSFGIWSYMSQSNNNADCVPEDLRFKFVDDLSSIEIINLVSIGLSTYNVKSHVPSHIPDHNQIIPAQHLKSQEYLNKINSWTENQKMVLNPRKTSAIIFNRSTDKQFAVELTVKGEKIQTVSETKLLGTIITSDLKWDKNTEKLIKESNQRLRLLHRCAKFTDRTQDLLQVYKTFVRSKLEYGCVVWHSSLSEKNKKDLERVQKCAFKIILKLDYESYEHALRELKMDSLDDRRRKLCLRFAENCLKSRTRNMFPLNQSNHIMEKRSKEKFKDVRCNTERFRKSALPYMRKILNKDYSEKKKILGNLIN